MIRLLILYVCFFYSFTCKSQVGVDAQMNMGILYQPMYNHTEIGGIVTFQDLSDSLGIQIGYHQNDAYHKYLVGINAHLTNQWYLHGSLDFLSRYVNKSFFYMQVDGWRIGKKKKTYKLINKGFDLDLELGLSKCIQVWQISPELALQWQTYGSFNARFDQFLVATGINLKIRK